MILFDKLGLDRLALALANTNALLLMFDVLTLACLTGRDGESRTALYCSRQIPNEYVGLPDAS